jgi:hypothetical protein
MACGGRKTPPPHTHTHAAMCGRSENNVTLETSTSSNDNPDIPIEPVTPVPQGVNIQESFRLTLIITHSSVAHIIQPDRSLNQPLDFTDI